MKRFSTTIGVAAISLLIAISASYGTERLPAGFVNWSSHGGDADENAYGALDQINRTDIGRLGLAWSLDLDDERILEATPLAIDGTLYFTGSYAKVYAVDARSGKLLWSYDPQEWKPNPDKLKVALPVNRGAAYADGRVFAATLDGRLIALDAKSGRLMWSVRTVPLQSMQTITGAPRVLRGKVLIGNGGGDFGERGYLSAYDTATGRLLWRTYMVPGTTAQNQGNAALERAATTWSGGGTPGGGAPWDSITVDPALDRVYVGTGNPSPNDPSERSPGGGDNLYGASIVALDADTGKYIWHYQVNPRDAWDFDATQQMILADLQIAGRKRQVLMQAPKNGFLYVLDRRDGRLLTAGKIGKATWADHIDLATGRPVEAPGIRYQQGPVVLWPTPLGAHSWQTMSFSPATGLVYIPTMQLGMRYSRVTDPKDRLYGGMSTTVVKTAAEDGKGALVAIDPVRQQIRWKVAHDGLWNGGTLATAGGLVFQGSTDGLLNAYDASNGRLLWHFNAGLGIIASPITYAVGGRQYVSVLVGYGGSNVMGVMDLGWKFGAQPRRLLTFALDGKAILPPTAPRDFTVHALDEPGLALIPADIAAGGKLFQMNCAGCHGLDAVSAGPPGPDLRESALALNRDSFASVVHDGAMLPLGMPPFPKMDSAQIGQLYVYIRSRARQALAER